ncbi:hypothetical protein VTK26DRAFT_1293 [Humicola hyalothermophila]
MDAGSAPSLNGAAAGWSSFSRPVPLFRSSTNTESWARGQPSSSVCHLTVPRQDRRTTGSSATWTSSSDDFADVSDIDDVQARSEFVQEYNRMAKKHGVRTLLLETYSPSLPGQSPIPQRRSWLSRTFLRQASATSDASSTRSEKKVKLKRSVSDLALHLVNGAKKDSLKDEDLESLVRLCGKSTLYLPSEYAPSSLILPTCFRATAYHLSQYGADTRGVFRIPGSVRTVNALYDYYCADGDADEIASTIRCPNLPAHIKAGTHDVASAFKRFLSGLPGGILGSLSVFDALVAIHSQLKGDPEFPRTKQTKLRARLIALAIGTIRSQLRRDLICAVFGLLCMIGRAAEKAPREDSLGRPLPTADLMGYNALGIVFGPLLVGDLLGFYMMRIADPASGLVVFPVTPPPVKKERWKCHAGAAAHPPAQAVDKIHVANSITEMLITHWREIVRQMRSLGNLKRGATRTRSAGLAQKLRQTSGLRPSISELTVGKSAGWAPARPPSGTYGIRGSPIPPTPTPEHGRNTGGSTVLGENLQASLVVERRRPRGARPLSHTGAGARTGTSLLSLPTEEAPLPSVDARKEPSVKEQPRDQFRTHNTPRMEEMGSPPTECAASGRIAMSSTVTVPSPLSETPPSRPMSSQFDLLGEHAARRMSLSPVSAELRSTPKRFIRFPHGIIGPRAERRREVPSIAGQSKGSSPRPNTAESGITLSQETSIDGQGADRRKGTPSTPSVRHTRSKTRRASNLTGGGEQTERPKRANKRTSRDLSNSTVRGLVRFSRATNVEDKALRNDKPRIDMFERGRSRLAAWKSRRRSSLSMDEGSPTPRSLLRGGAEAGILGSRSPIGNAPRGRGSAVASRSRNSQEQAQANSTVTEQEGHSRAGTHILGRSPYEHRTSVESNQETDRGEQPELVQGASDGAMGGPTGHYELGEHVTPSNTNKAASQTTMRLPLPISIEPPAQLRPSPASRLTPVKSAGTAVKAMAARFESVSRTSTLPAHKERTGSGIDTKPSGVVSQYTVNPAPVRTPTKASRKTQSDSFTPTRRSLRSVFQQRQFWEVRGKGGKLGDEVTADSRRPALDMELVPEAIRWRGPRCRSEIFPERGENSVNSRGPIQTDQILLPSTVTRQTSPSLGNSSRHRCLHLEQNPATVTTLTPTPTNTPEQPQPQRTPTTSPFPIRSHSRRRPTTPATSPSSPPLSASSHTHAHTPVPPTPTTPPDRHSTTPAEQTTTSSSAPHHRRSRSSCSPQQVQSRSQSQGQGHGQQRRQQQQEEGKGEENEKEQQATTTTTIITTTEIARLRDQLARAEQACAAWRARAVRAERRVVVLERVVRVRAQCVGGHGRYVSGGDGGDGNGAGEEGRDHDDGWDDENGYGSGRNEQAGPSCAHSLGRNDGAGESEGGEGERELAVDGARNGEAQGEDVGGEGLDESDMFSSGGSACGDGSDGEEYGFPAWPLEELLPSPEGSISELV